MSNKKKRRTDGIFSTSPTLYYFLSFTVGLPMSLIGAIYALLMLILGYKPFIYYNSICFKCRKSDGISLGCFIFVSRGCKEALMVHELGHTIQNCLYGPLMPFVVGIPSSARYHYRKFKTRVMHRRLTSNYYDVWFEAEASDLGANYIKRINNPTNESN